MSRSEISMVDQVFSVMPKKKKRVKVKPTVTPMVRKRSVIKAALAGTPKSPLKTRSQIDVISRAADRNARKKGVGTFTKRALQGGLRRGDVDFAGVLGGKSMPVWKHEGTLFKKKTIERVPIHDARTGKAGKTIGLVHKKGAQDYSKPHSANVRSLITSKTRERTGKPTKMSFTSIGRQDTLSEEMASIISDDRKEALKSFKTGIQKRDASGKIVPKGKRRRKIRVW
jgi:hypothetical protein